MTYFPALLLVVLLGTSVHAQSSDPPFSLEDCVTYARQYSPALERQRIGYTNRLQGVESARAKYDPVFSAKDAWVEASDTHTMEGSVDQTLPADLGVRASVSNQQRENSEDVVTYALRLSKTLLGGGTLLESRLPVDQARLDEAKSWNTVSLETRRIRLTVARVFYEVVRNQQTLRLRRLQLERAHRNLEIAMVKEDPLDIATARLRIPESELDVLSAQRAITNALLNLREVIGLPMGEPLSVATNIDYQVRPVEVDEDVALALSDHEAIRNAHLDIEKAELNFRSARTKRLPEVSAQVSVRDTDEDGAAGDPDTRAELVVTWPWLDRRDRAEATRRSLELKDNQIALYQAQQEREKVIASLALSLEEAERTVRLQEDRVEVLEQQLELYQDRWENGEINILEYIRSQNNLEDARVQLVSQKTRYLELLAEYDFNVGR